MAQPVGKPQTWLERWAKIVSNANWKEQAIAVKARHLLGTNWTQEAFKKGIRDGAALAKLHSDANGDLDEMIQIISNRP